MNSSSCKAKALRDLRSSCMDKGIKWKTFTVLNEGGNCVKATVAVRPSGLLNFEIAVALCSVKDQYNKFEGQVRSGMRLLKKRGSFLIARTDAEADVTEMIAKIVAEFVGRVRGFEGNIEIRLRR